MGACLSDIGCLPTRASPRRFFFLSLLTWLPTVSGEPCIPSEDPPGALEFRERFTDSLVSDTRKPSQNSIVLRISRGERNAAE